MIKTSLDLQRAGKPEYSPIPPNIKALVFYHPKLYIGKDVCHKMLMIIKQQGILLWELPQQLSID